jgi:hypothetical protein
MTDKTFKQYLTEMHSCGCDDNCSCGGNCTPDCNCHSGCVAIVVKEDSVDMEKHNTLNDIFQALEQLKTEVDELDALDSDMDSTGVGDLNDQLTTFRKHISALYQVLDRAGRIVPMESVNEVEESKDLEHLKKLAGI